MLKQLRCGPPLSGINGQRARQEVHCYGKLCRIDIRFVEEVSEFDRPLPGTVQQLSWSSSQRWISDETKLKLRTVTIKITACVFGVPQ